MLVVVVLLGGIGIVYNGRFPPIPPTFYGALLAIVWGRVLWDFRRYGKQMFSLWVVVYLIGYSAYMGGNLLAPGTAVREGVINIGLLLVLAFFARSIFVPRRRPQTPYDSSH